MNLQPVLDRLMEKLGSDVRTIKGAIEYAAALEEGVKNPPALFVVPENEDAKPNPTIGVTRQRNTVTFAVVSVTQSLKDSRGEDVQDPLQKLRSGVFDAILGYAWADTETTNGSKVDNVEFVGGSLIDFDDGQVWWQDNFKTGHTLRYAN